MNTLFLILGIIYYSINIFMCGIYSREHDSDSKWYQFFFYVVIALFGTVFLLIAQVVDGVKALNEVLHITFFWKFIVLREFRDGNIVALYKTNVCTNKHFTSNSLKDRIERFAVRLLNKANNYVYDPATSEQQAKNWESIEELKNIYRKISGFIREYKYEELKEELNMYLDPDYGTSISQRRAALDAIKPLSDEPEFAPYWKQLIESIESEIGKIY